MAGCTGWSGDWPPLAMRRSVRPECCAADCSSSGSASAGRCHEQEQLTGSQLQCKLVQLAVGGGSLREILAALDESRRVDDQHVETLAGLAERGQHVEGITPAHRDFQPVGAGIALRPFERRGGRIDAERRAGAGGERRNGPAADVTAHVQDSRAGGLLRQQGSQLRAVGPLVVEPAGLLAIGQRHLEPQPSFHHVERFGQFAIGADELPWQAFQVARIAIVLPDQPGIAQRGLERGLDIPAALFHRKGGDLAHQHVAVTIHHQPGQIVRLAIDQPVVLAAHIALPQRQRRTNPAGKQFGAYRLFLGATHHPRTDQRMRIAQRVAQEPLAVVEHAHGRAGLDGRQRRAGGIHLVREHPAVSRADARIFVALQHQRRQVGAARICHSRGF